MITEGTYPLVTGGVSTWCDQLLRGMAEHEFVILALSATGAEAHAWAHPENLAECVSYGVWGPMPQPLPWSPGRGRMTRLAADALHEFWQAALGPSNRGSVTRCAGALRVLAELGARGRLSRVLATIDTVEPIMAAWRRHHPDDSESPGLAVADAAAAAAIVDRTLGVLDARMPRVDITHATSNGPCALVGLGELWTNGTPMLLTEHGVYLRERYLALHDAGLSHPMRQVVMAFLKAISRVAYRHATAVLPVNKFNARWERRFGASETQLRTIPNGVNPEQFTPVETEPEVPTISFVGRIDPLKDLETLIRAFGIVHAKLPQARLRLFGPVPGGNEGYRDGLVAVAEELGISSAVTWEGPSKGSRPAIEAGHIIALSSISEGLPFTVIEAMMCGRATVNTDVGGVSECLDDDLTTGRLVPARDPEAFAAACLELLTDDNLRRQMGAAARERALERFTLDACINAYRREYDAARQAAVGLGGTPPPLVALGSEVQPARVAPSRPALATTAGRGARSTAARVLAPHGAGPAVRAGAKAAHNHRGEAAAGERARDKELVLAGRASDGDPEA